MTVVPSTVWVTLTVTVQNVPISPADSIVEIADKTKAVMKSDGIEYEDCYNVRVISWQTDDNVEWEPVMAEVIP